MKCLYVSLLLLPAVTCFFGSFNPDSGFSITSGSGNSSDLRSTGSSISSGWSPVTPGHTSFPWPTSPLQILTNFTFTPSAGEIILTVTTVEEKSLKLNLSISRGKLSLPDCGYGPENPRSVSMLDGTANPSASIHANPAAVLLLGSDMVESGPEGSRIRIHEGNEDLSEFPTYLDRNIKGGSEAHPDGRFHDKSGPKADLGTDFVGKGGTNNSRIDSGYNFGYNSSRNSVSVNSTNPGKDGLVVWSLNKTNKDLTLLKDGVTQVVVDISNCSWSERLQSVTIHKDDTASLKYRSKPDSCLGDLPPHLSLSSDTFPVSDGHTVAVSCKDEGFKMNVGSESMTCDTNMYGAWKVRGGETKPWCLGVKMMGGEGVVGVTDTITIGCTFSHFPPHTTNKPAEIEWRLDDGTTVEGTIVTNVSGTSITSNLTLPSFPNSVGEHTYTCSPKTHPTWKAPVSVRVFRVTTISKDSAVGRSATLSCNVVNTPQHSEVTWWFGEERVTKGVTTSTPEIGSLFSSLTIAATQMDLNFTCKVQTPSKIYTFPVELDTYEVLGVLLDVCAAECRVQGVRSAMDISWHLNGQPHSEAVSSEPDGTGMQRSVALKLRNPGVYTCVVRSRVRPSSEPLSVDVRVDPKPSSSPTLGPITWILVAMVFILLSVICGGVLFMLRQKKRVHRLSMRVTSRKYLESVGDIPSIYRQRCSSGASFSRRDSLVSGGKMLSSQISVPAMTELDRSLTISRTEEEDEEGEE
eukprot:sb/3462393/